MCSARSRTGWTVTWVSGLPHQVRTCSAVTGPAVSWTRAQPAGAEDRGVFEVDVQHHLTTLATRPLRRGCRW